MQVPSPLKVLFYFLIITKSKENPRIFFYSTVLEQSWLTYAYNMKSNKHVTELNYNMQNCRWVELTRLFVHDIFSQVSFSTISCQSLSISIFFGYVREDCLQKRKKALKATVGDGTNSSRRNTLITIMEALLDQNGRLNIHLKNVR